MITRPRHADRTLRRGAAPAGRTGGRARARSTALAVSLDRATRGPGPLWSDHGVACFRARHRRRTGARDPPRATARPAATMHEPPPTRVWTLSKRESTTHNSQGVARRTSFVSVFAPSPPCTSRAFARLSALPFSWSIHALTTAPLPVVALAHTTYVSLVLWSKREVG